MKERDTVIVSIRIPKTMLAQLDSKVPMSNRKSRNDWLIWAIDQGLRTPKRDDVNKEGIS